MRWLRWLLRVKVIALKPGDAILVYLRRSVPDGYMTNASHAMRRMFPDNPTLFIDDSVRKVAIARRV